MFPTIISALISVERVIVSLETQTRDSSSTTSLSVYKLLIDKLHSFPKALKRHPLRILQGSFYYIMEVLIHIAYNIVNGHVVTLVAFHISLPFPFPLQGIQELVCLSCFPFFL